MEKVSMKKLTVSVLGAFMACLSLAACSSDDDPSSCGFEAGIYDVTSVNYRGDTGLCVDLAQELNTASSNRGKARTFTKIDDATFEARDTGNPNAAPTTYKVDGGSCQLRTSATTTMDATYAGKAIKLTLSAVTTLNPTGTDTYATEAVAEVTSSTTGATGVPCTLTGNAAGTRRR